MDLYQSKLFIASGIIKTNFSSSVSIQNSILIGSSPGFIKFARDYRERPAHTARGCSRGRRAGHHLSRSRKL